MHFLTPAHFSTPSFFVRPEKPVSSSRPASSGRRRAQGRSRLAAFSGHPKGVALTVPSTGATLAVCRDPSDVPITLLSDDAVVWFYFFTSDLECVRRLNDQRRARSKASTYHRATTLYSVDPCSDPDHDAAMRIDREAPWWWSPFCTTVSKPWDQVGPPPPRTVVGADAGLSVEVRETMPLFCDHGGVIRHLPVFRRSSPSATGRSIVCAQVRRSWSSWYLCDDLLFGCNTTPPGHSPSGTRETAMPVQSCRAALGRCQRGQDLFPDVSRRFRPARR